MTQPRHPSIAPILAPEAPARWAAIPRLGRVCRLGLASRGNTTLERDAVLAAIDRGVDYLNWCGRPDGMQEAIRRLGSRRREVKVAVQLEARSGAEARRELAGKRMALGTEYLDMATYYYVESREEWEEIVAPGGAADVLEEVRREGVVRAIGLTSHQRPLAAEIAAGGRLDLLMIRYNAAHRGAEDDVFPIVAQRRLPVVAFTCTRWGALLKPTLDDPPEFSTPTAAELYQFVLANPAVSVALMAPDGPEELEENLAMLGRWEGLPPARYAALRDHGDRVRRWAGSFP